MTEEDQVVVDNGNSNNNTSPSLQYSGLMGLKQQIEASDDSSQSESDQSVEMLTTAVVSFVFVSKQASLFNLLIQMLSTNKFAPVQNQFNIPFQPSPDPYVVSPAHQQSLSSNKDSLNNLTSASASKTSALMFHVLNDAINSVTQQYQKNFYIHIIERTDGGGNTNNPAYNQVLAGCLSFINHMLSAAPTHFDFERYRQLLSAQGVNDMIKKQIKNVDPNVRSELLHYQKHKIANIKTGKLIVDKQSIDHLLSRLIKISFPNKIDETTTTNANTSTMEGKMKVLGFSGESSTVQTNELLGTGILGLRNLIYFGARYSRIYQEILNVQMNRDQEDAIYSFVNVAMCLTNCIFEIYIDDENLYEVIFDQDDWFEEMFSISFELFDEIWEKEAKVPEDFVTVLHKTRNILSRIKWTNQDSIQSFQIALGTVLDEIWNREDEIVEDQHRRLMPLSDSIIGLPGSNSSTGHHANNGANTNHSNSSHATQRFQKFFKSRKDSSDELALNSSSGSVASNIDSAPPSPSLQGSQESTSSTPGRKATHIRQHMKSMSFKKLFEFKEKNNNSNSQTSTLNNSSPLAQSGEYAIRQVDDGVVEEKEKEKEKDEEEKKSFERIIKVLKNTAATLKMKQSGDRSTASKEIQVEAKSDSLDVVVVNTPISASQDHAEQQTLNISVSASSSIEIENSKLHSGNNSPSFNGLPLSDDMSSSSSPKMGTSDKLKASGSVMYKTVKKVMHSIEKKGKTIKKRVKKRRALDESALTEEERAAKLEKKLKKKERKKMKNVQYERENDTVVLQMSDGTQRLDRGSFQELNLDLDGETDSLDSSDSEDSEDESGTTTMDDYDNVSEPQNVSSSSLQSSPQMVVPKLKISNNLPKSESNSSINTQTSTSTCVSPKEYPISASNSSNNLLNSNNNNNNNNNTDNNSKPISPRPQLSPKPTEQQTASPNLLTPRSSNSERKSVKDMKEVFDSLDELSKGYSGGSSAEHSTSTTPRSTLSTPRKSINLSTNTFDAPAKPGSMKQSTSSTDIEGEQKRSTNANNRMSSFMKGPFGTIERRKDPTMTKSTSIKQLVSFFEQKNEPSPPPSLIRQRSQRDFTHRNSDNNLTAHFNNNNNNNNISTTQQQQQ